MFIALAVDYPDAEIALEAPRAGPSAPALFLNRLSAEEAEEVAARLSAPELADVNQGVYVIPFAILNGPSGELNGTLGGVPRTG